ncbi:MAG: hypothetical protein PHE55_13025 [Methylococcaceae bacterium]|nr:hypothetical protein [Methylococcaceae bacterium]
MYDKNDKSVRATLREYVKDRTKWFFWYHNIQRLEAIKKFENEDKHNNRREVKEKEDRFLKGFKIDKVDPIMDLLLGFLDSTLDEARLKKANDFTEYALYISDRRSFSYFRRAESRKEMSGEIDYDKHRDHAVHTLYNYLLGWYIFDHLHSFRCAFREIFKKLEVKFENHQYEKNFYSDSNREDLRPKKENPTGTLTSMSLIDFLKELPLVNHFGDVWPVASLLHDVGYILEGSLSPASPKIEHERVTNGAKVLHDYFNHWAWRNLPVDFRAAASIAKSIECVVPDFTGSKSLPSLADRLRDIGYLENIRKQCIREQTTRSISPLVENIYEGYALNLEAFKLWELFYKHYSINPMDANPMEEILKQVKEKYKDDVWKGSDTAKINLNHGVCGGLMLLQAATFWHERIWGLEPEESWVWEKIQNGICDKNKASLPVSKTTFNSIRDSLTYTENHQSHIPAHIWLRGWFSYTDWIKDLWATASVAIHDYVTQKTWNPDKEDKLRIKLEADPLAYLQILVDVLQEWDRYTVLGESAFSGKEPLQSYETKLAVRNQSKLRLAYPKRNEYEDEIEKTLDRILIDWNEYIEIKGPMLKERFVMDDKRFVELTLWPSMPLLSGQRNVQAIEYRLVFVVERKCALRYEGKIGKDGLKYLDGVEKSYSPMKPEDLLTDFRTNVKEQGGNASGPSKSESWFFRDVEELPDEVQLRVDDWDTVDVNRFVETYKKGKWQGSYINFKNEVGAKAILTDACKKILEEMTRVVGPVIREELAKRLGCPKREIEVNVNKLLDAGILDNTSDGKIVFPYNAFEPKNFQLPQRRSDVAES